MSLDDLDDTWMGSSSFDVALGEWDDTEWVPQVFIQSNVNFFMLQINCIQIFDYIFVLLKCLSWKCIWLLDAIVINYNKSE